METYVSPAAIATTVSAEKTLCLVSAITKKPNKGADWAGTVKRCIVYNTV